MGSDPEYDAQLAVAEGLIDSNSMDEAGPFSSTLPMDDSVEAIYQRTMRGIDRMLHQLRHDDTIADVDEHPRVDVPQPQTIRDRLKFERREKQLSVDCVCVLDLASHFVHFNSGEETAETITAVLESLRRREREIVERRAALQRLKSSSGSGSNGGELEL